MKIIQEGLMYDNSPPANHIHFTSKIYTMKQATLLITTVFLFSYSTIAQLDKKNLLIGGTGTFSSLNNKFNSTTVVSEHQRTVLTILPNVGYFVVDKLAIGLRTSLEWSKIKGISSNSLGTSNTIRFDYGLFCRYYFLDKEKQYNILTDLSYQFGSLKLTEDKGMRNTFTAMAGAEFFLNSSVGIEFLIGYKAQKEKLTTSSSTPQFFYTDKKNGVLISIGFQFHLEKL